MTFSKAHFLRLACVACASIALSACGSGSNSALEEKLQRAEQAAQRAEAAQARAEQAANKAVAFTQHASTPAPVDQPSPAERDMQKASQDPNSAYYDNSVGTTG